VTRRPPRLATAILRRFGPQNDALAGDLLERFQRRSSWTLWYWWQVGIAIRLEAVREIGRRPIAVTATVVFGWVVWWVLLYGVAFPIVLAVDHAYSLWRMRQGHDAQLFGQTFVYTSLAIAIAAEAISAMVAVRAYRGHRPMLALLYAGFVVVRCVGWLTLNSIHYGPADPLHFAINLRPFSIGAVVHLFPIPSLTALAAGMWAASRQEERIPTGFA
jgi:hypothetical protein